ncbi:hypothetical protein LTR85_003092 [Meristemomyces frigidus]|nr:hypothetical protein LTR85_003092 [Meristemomyces frigidus]
MSAQLLDDQLSRDIDATLAKINTMLPHVSTGQPTPTPVLPTMSLTPQMAPQFPPTPPQLPMLDFYQDFSMNAFPELAPSRRTPTPPVTLSQLSLPSWCPALPFLTRKGAWSNGMPTFYDLSSLPEPREATKAEPRCQELQLWRGDVDLTPRVSRFFPRSSSPAKPKVKLPPTACKLYSMETALPDPLSALPRADTYAVKRKTLAESLESVVNLFKDPGEPSHLASVPEPEPSAANLWHILAGQDDARHCEQDDPYLASFTSGPDNDDKGYTAAWKTAIETYDLLDVLTGQHRATLSKQEDLDPACFTPGPGNGDEKYLTAWQTATESYDDVNANTSPDKAQQYEREEPYATGFDPEVGPDSSNASYLAAWQKAVAEYQRAEGLTSQDDVPAYERTKPNAAVLKPGSKPDSLRQDYRAVWHEFIEAYNHAHGPAELQGKEVPYIHANSLTGHSNEVTLSPYADEHPTLSDSGVSFTPLASPPIGLNEMMVDYDVEPLCYGEGIHTGDAYLESYPTPSSASHTFVLADILPIDCVREDGGEEALTKSDAHFQSEQELFELPALPDSPAESIIDVADFLKMGHAKPCWCTECDEVPDLEANDQLTAPDDDWVFYSAADDTSTVSQASTEADDDEKQSARIQCGTDPDWADFLPSTPGSLKQAVDEVDTFGGSQWDWEFEF